LLHHLIAVEDHEGTGSCHLSAILQPHGFVDALVKRNDEPGFFYIFQSFLGRDVYRLATIDQVPMLQPNDTKLTPRVCSFLPVQNNVVITDDITDHQLPNTTNLVPNGFLEVLGSSDGEPKFISFGIWFQETRPRGFFHLTPGDRHIVVHRGIGPRGNTNRVRWRAWVG